MTRYCTTSTQPASGKTWTIYQRHAKILYHFHATCLRKDLDNLPAPCQDTVPLPRNLPQERPGQFTSAMPRYCTTSTQPASGKTWTIYQRHAKILYHFHATCLRKDLDNLPVPCQDTVPLPRNLLQERPGQFTSAMPIYCTTSTQPASGKTWTIYQRHAKILYHFPATCLRKDLDNLPAPCQDTVPLPRNLLQETLGITWQDT
ncbi:hypothetical protein ACOMHN_053240 [Nucella lapillus]